MSPSPSQVDFTRHAEQRARIRGIDLRAAGELVLERHDRRRKNPGAADWLLVGRGIGVTYNWPDEGDPSQALVITVWEE